MQPKKGVEEVGGGRKKPKNICVESGKSGVLQLFQTQKKAKYGGVFQPMGIHWATFGLYIWERFSAEIYTCIYYLTQFVPKCGFRHGLCLFAREHEADKKRTKNRP